MPERGEPLGAGWSSLLFERNPDPMWVVDRETLRFLAVNEAAIQGYGYTREDFLRMSSTDLRAPEDIPALVAAVGRARAGGAPIGQSGLQRHRRKDGSLVDVEIAWGALEFDGRQAFLVTARDVTERARADAKLRASETRFRALLEHATEGYVLLAADGTLIEVSPSTPRILGYEPSEMKGRQGAELLHPDDAESALAAFHRVALRPGASERVLRRVRHADGSWRWLEGTYTNLLDDPAVGAIVSNCRDVTERYASQAALRESERRFASFMDHMPGAAFIKDAEGRYIYMNRICERAMDLSGDWQGRRDEDLVPAETAHQFQGSDAQVRATSRALQVVEHVGARDWLVTKFPIPDPASGSMIGGIGIDITERQRAERERERLLAATRHQRARLEALSRRLGTVQEEERRRIARELHDEVGQLLTGLKLLIESGRGADEPLKLVGEIMARVRGLSLDLRPPMLDTLGLVPALLWHIDRFASQTGVRAAFEEAGVRRRYPRGLELVAFRIVQEALTNVARHAGAQRASVRVESGETSLRLLVADEGRGFDPGIVAEGLAGGLVGMEERARLVGGRLSIDSRPGGGTRIEAELPVARGAR